ncbi:hypothetical protein, partial [Bilophila wadsworthia]|uniref:hypothetical protein n=1 Tax=Bilophila wadsworthia TaxID=35833 RepID=UPI003A8C46B6
SDNQTPCSNGLISRHKHDEAAKKIPFGQSESFSLAKKHPNKKGSTANQSPERKGIRQSRCPSASSAH